VVSTFHARTRHPARRLASATREEGIRRTQQQPVPSQAPQAGMRGARWGVAPPSGGGRCWWLDQLQARSRRPKSQAGAFSGVSVHVPRYMCPSTCAPRYMRGKQTISTSSVAPRHMRGKQTISTSSVAQSRRVRHQLGPMCCRPIINPSACLVREGHGSPASEVPPPTPHKGRGRYPPC
jgi:hypothetical protein